MRVVLVLCLLAFISCQNDIMVIAKSLYENPKVQELFGDVMVAIVTKDFSKLWEKVKESLPELIQAVIKCVTEEVNLQMKIVSQCILCRQKCKAVYEGIFYDDCMKNCQKYYCDHGI